MVRWYLAPLEQFDLGPRRVWHARTFRYAKPPHRCSNTPMQRGDPSTWWGVSRVDADAAVHAAIDADTAITRLAFRDSARRDLTLDAPMTRLSRADGDKLRADLTARGVDLTGAVTARDVVRRAMAAAMGVGNDSTLAPWLSRY